MPLPEFRASLERTEGLAHHIETSGERAEELEPVLWRILDKIMDREKRMFETRGATSGVYWAPLRGTTVKRKSAMGMPHVLDPLRGLGTLEESLTKYPAPNQIVQVDNRGFLFASTVQSAAYHATGTSRMPARPPLIIPAKHAQEYIGMLNDFIFEIDDDA